MTPRVNTTYRMPTIVGASITVAAPLGQYHDSKVLNLGSNRWTVKPEIGLSRSPGRWIVEGMAGICLFTGKIDFFWRAHVRTGSDRTGAGPSHLPLQSQGLDCERRQLLKGRRDNGRRCHAPRHAKQRARQLAILVGARSAPCASRLTEPRRLSHHRRRFHQRRPGLQLGMDAQLTNALLRAAGRSRLMIFLTACLESRAVDAQAQGKAKEPRKPGWSNSADLSLVLTAGNSAAKPSSKLRW